MAAMGHLARWAHLHPQAAAQHWAQATSICRNPLLLLAGEPGAACHQVPWATCHHHSRKVDEVGMCHTPVTQPVGHFAQVLWHQGAWGTCHHSRNVGAIGTHHSLVMPLAMQIDRLGNSHRAPHHQAMPVAAGEIIMALTRRRTCQPNHQVWRGRVDQIQRRCVSVRISAANRQKAHRVTVWPRQWTGYRRPQRHEEGHHQLTGRWGLLIVQWPMASRTAQISSMLASNRRPSSSPRAPCLHLSGSRAAGCTDSQMRRPACPACPVGGDFAGR